MAVLLVTRHKCPVSQTLNHATLDCVTRMTKAKSDDQCNNTVCADDVRCGSIPVYIVLWKSVRIFKIKKINRYVYI